MEEIKIGHFTGEIKNGSWTIIEIDLQSDGNYSLLAMEKKIKFTKPLLSQYAVNKDIFQNHKANSIL